MWNGRHPARSLPSSKYLSPAVKGGETKTDVVETFRDKGNNKRQQPSLTITFLIRQHSAHVPTTSHLIGTKPVLLSLNQLTLSPISRHFLSFHPHQGCSLTSLPRRGPQITTNILHPSIVVSLTAPQDGSPRAQVGENGRRSLSASLSPILSSLVICDITFLGLSHTTPQRFGTTVSRSIVNEQLPEPSFVSRISSPSSSMDNRSMPCLVSVKEASSKQP